jgi:DNA-binding IclR family transcriptional regulator
MIDADAQSVKSGARILDMIELIAARDTSLGLADVVTELGIPKSSALMLLRTLVAKHYVERDTDGRYRLDEAYRSSNNDWVGGRMALLRRTARPLMQELGSAVQETVVVGILTPSVEVKVIEKVRSPRHVRYEIDVGVPYPAYCTAIGRSILGFSDPGLVDHYLRTVTMTKCTENTVTDPAAIRDILALVRKQGYAVNIEEHVQGASSVAAPLLNHRGEVVAALNVGCVTAHFVNNRETITNLLVAAASRLSKRLGEWN